MSLLKQTAVGGASDLGIGAGRYSAKTAVTIGYGVESGHFGGGGTVTLPKGTVIHIDDVVEGADDLSFMMRNVSGLRKFSRDFEAIHRQPGVAWFEMTEEQFHKAFRRTFWG